MATADRYAIPTGDLGWDIPQSFETNFNWEYQDGRESLLKLYSKGKKRQWDVENRIDWSQELDPENPVVIAEWANELHRGEEYAGALGLYDEYVARMEAMGIL